MKIDFTIIVTPNYKNRTLTIRKNYTDGLKVKYRTVQQNKNDFDSLLNNTQKDWQYFLNSCNGDYFVVKNYYNSLKN